MMKALLLLALCVACSATCHVPKDWTVISDTPCTSIRYLCLDGYEPWSNKCGCGCKPMKGASVTSKDTVICSDLAKECPDGSFVVEDPNNHCKFPKCPCNLPKDWTVISRKPCTSITYLCMVGYQPWSNECGCGCKPSA
eukprot:TRINITY_DN357_c1_g1_i5.p2 TRINITY_DN357_c1_g1~~TRINITY_DN357_c1_g1_i5.p2  ORF type:complete len:139 (+),score=38.19 TRINITY_DN357_c1_g1_i5:1763-2179(+)